jgi:hypothetical protein
MVFVGFSTTTRQLVILIMLIEFVGPLNYLSLHGILIRRDVTENDSERFVHKFMLSMNNDLVKEFQKFF